MHRAQPDEPGAVARLLALHDEFPETLWGQMAVLHAAPSMLYASRDPASRARALEELEARAARVTFDAVRRPLHLTLARAYIDFGGPRERALDHLLAARVEDAARWQVRADSYVQIGELARRTGRAELAREYFSRFHRAFPRDYRHYMIGEILRDLEAAP